MAPSRPIAVGSPSNGTRRGSMAGLASSFAASLVDPSPLAQEVVNRDIAELTPSEIQAEADVAAARRASAAAPGLPEFEVAEDDDSDLGTPGSSAPYLYRRPSAIAYGNRPILGAVPIEPPALTKIEKLRSREAERSLLRDNHLLPPKHAAAAAGAVGASSVGGAGVDGAVAGGGAGGGGGGSGGAAARPGFFDRLYKRVFGTRRPVVAARPSAPVSDDEDEDEDGEATEHTALLGDGGERGPRLDQQWEAAVAAGQIHTTWQREAKTIAVYSQSLIVTFLLQYSINITGVFAVGHIGKAELGAVSRELFSCARPEGYGVWKFRVDAG